MIEHKRDHWLHSYRPQRRWLSPEQTKCLWRQLIKGTRPSTNLIFCRGCR